MFKSAIIIKAPSGRYEFVGRVHANLCDKSYATLEDAKVAAIDCMIEIGETFSVSVNEKEAA